MIDKTPEYLKVMERKYDLNPYILAIGLVENGSKVLSIGCGAGREVRELVRKGCQVTAIDYDGEMILSSRVLEPNVTYIKKDFRDFKTKERYDYVLCLWNVINFNKPEFRKRIIQQAINLLNSNGKLILTTATKYSHWKRFLHNIHHRDSYYPSGLDIDLWFDNNQKVQKISIDKDVLLVVRK